MDQLLGRADLPVHPHFAGLVAKALIETPEGRLAYRQRVEVLFTNSFQVGTLTNRVRSWATAIASSVPSSVGRSIDRESLELCERIRRRAVEVGRQLSLPMPGPLKFTNGLGSLAEWRAVDEPAGGALDRAAAPDGRKTLHLLAGPTTSASWRQKVILEPGQYRLEGLVRTRGLKPLPFGKNHGAALDVTAAKPTRPRWLTYDANWTQLGVDFEIVGRESEMRAAGERRRGVVRRGVVEVATKVSGNRRAWFTSLQLPKGVCACELSAG
jgi:hypothetical protein